jgi:hypothetical protein
VKYVLTVFLASIAVALGLGNVAHASDTRPKPGEVLKADSSEVDWSPQNGIKVRGHLIQACSLPAETNKDLCFESSVTNVVREYDSEGNYTGRATFDHTYTIHKR